MKKLIAMAALAVAATSASAAGLSAFATYDYDNLQNASGVFMHRGQAGMKAEFGALGAFDVSAVGGRVFAGGASASDQGLELGYSNGFTLGKVGITGRLGVAHLNESKLDVLRASVVGSYPLTGKISAIAGVEHVRVEGDAAANRFTLGADFAVTKTVSVRAAYARTNIVGATSDANGLTATINYKF